MTSGWQWNTRQNALLLNASSAGEYLKEIRRPMAEYGRNVPPGGPEGLFRITAEQREVVLPATGEPTVLLVQVLNTSAIIDGYSVEALDAPQWLKIESGQVRVLPDSEEPLPVTMRVAPPTKVPAQQIKITLLIRSANQAPAQARLPLLVTVPVLDEPVRLRAEPSVIRVLDHDSATCMLIADNSGSNRPVQLHLVGSDPKLAVHFLLEPHILEVGPAAWASARVTVTTARPEPGQEISRQLTLTALDGDRRVDTPITFVQATSALPMSLPLQPESVPTQSSEERRPLARLLLTLFGALAMILGALLPWRAGSEQRGVDLNAATFARTFDFRINLRGAESSISVGLVIMALGLLMIFGVGGRSGRLSRVAAVVGAILLIGTFVTFALAGDDIMPARGALLVLGGCIAAYIGGLLVKR